MKLQYHQGKNFGDQLNPLIFDYYLPGYFNNQEGLVVMGIGSILGFHDRFPGKKIVFSSGFDASQPNTYGQLPTHLDDFDFICVRGPKTAQLLGLDSSFAITDGAILLKEMVQDRPAKKYPISLMPHAGSEEFHNHQLLCDALGWQLISPKWEVEEVLEKIQQSELLITEAMHGAIVADTLRVPWIPYVGFKTIGTFKWEDWAASMEVPYRPFYLTPFFSKEKIGELINKRLSRFSLQALAPMVEWLLHWRFRMIWKRNLEILRNQAHLKNAFMSKDEVLNDRFKRLRAKLEEFKMKYPIEKFGG